MTDKPTGLALLRQPFPDHQISKLPKPTKAQTDAVRQNFMEGVRCDICGGWHHPKSVHLDYVGHAALTDRLLDCDPEWNWEPLSTDEHGQPVYQGGGMWIKLTVCGVTRLGFGDAEGKKGGNAIKEIIGDALRNAAMRFGAALDLWHKGDLHQEDDGEDSPKPQADERDEGAAEGVVKARQSAIGRLMSAPDLKSLATVWASLPADQKKDAEILTAKNEFKSAMEKEEKESPPPVDLDGDEIPYDKFGEAGPDIGDMASAKTGVGT